MTPDEAEAFVQALEDIAEWHRDHGRAAVVDGLRPGASERALDEAEAQARSPFGDELRALYRWHDGQRDREQHPFFEDLAFADLAYAQGLRDGMRYAYFGVRAGGVVDRSAIFTAEGSALREDEFDDRWFPIANDGGDFLAVHLGSGRVFHAKKDWPALHLRAASLGAFVAAYASLLWDEEYELDARGDPRVAW